jgi:uncharacterized membrane protein YgdD (TMEM256/DUF423 family)
MAVDGGKKPFLYCTHAPEGKGEPRLRDLRRRSIWTAAAAVNGFVAVAAGAFGAHAMGPGTREAAWLATASQYQITHALGMLAAILLVDAVAVPILFQVGIVCFAGALYAMALGGPTILGALAPIGGTCLLAGWVWFAVAAWRRGAI